MITFYILQVFVLWLNELVKLLPSATGSFALPTAVDTAFTSIVGYLQKANRLLPVDTMLQILGIILAIEGSILLFKIANWTYDKIRGAG